MQTIQQFMATIRHELSLALQRNALPSSAFRICPTKRVTIQYCFFYQYYEQGELVELSSSTHPAAKMFQ